MFIPKGSEKCLYVFVVACGMMLEAITQGSSSSSPIISQYCNFTEVISLQYTIALLLNVKEITITLEKFRFTKMLSLINYKNGRNEYLVDGLTESLTCAGFISAQVTSKEGSSKENSLCGSLFNCNPTVYRLIDNVQVLSKVEHKLSH